MGCVGSDTILSSAEEYISKPFALCISKQKTAVSSVPWSKSYKGKFSKSSRRFTKICTDYNDAFCLIIRSTLSTIGHGS